jgi:hypothetical protein
MLSAQPTTYQIVKSKDHTTIEFLDRPDHRFYQDRMDMTINRRTEEVTFSAPIGGPNGDEDVIIIIIESDVLLDALRNIGLL